MDFRALGLILGAFGCFVLLCEGYSIRRVSRAEAAGEGGRSVGRLRIRVTRARRGEAGTTAALQDELWRYDDRLNGSQSPEISYVSEVANNRPLWGLFKLFEEQKLEGRMEEMPGFTALELGCGEGRALLELQVRFPDAKLMCLNKEGYGQGAQEHGGSFVGGANRNGSVETLLHVAKYYGIDWHPDTHNTPQVIFLDATAKHVPIASDSVDIIFSRGVLNEGSEDVEALRGVLHVLKARGEAFLQHVDMQAHECPQLAQPGTFPMTLLCKKLAGHGKCLQVATQCADLRRYVDGRVLETPPIQIVGLVDDCTRSCDDEEADAIDKLSYTCGSSLPELVTAKLKRLSDWQA
jgi:SAM-dependent methyltransferase